MSQADWVPIDGNVQYAGLYLPMPVMLTQQTAERLRAWVSAGGTLISEGCPAYFGDQGRVGTVQPNSGLDEVFGASQSYVEFTPDLLTDLRLTVKDQPVWGGVFMQTFEFASGTVFGWDENRRSAAVEHQ